MPRTTLRTTPNVIRLSATLIPAILILIASLLTPTSVYASSADVQDLKQVRKLAGQGSIRDEIVLAGDYFVGKGVPQDSKMAAYWYEKAAGLGSPEAQNQIGYFYQAGIGVAADSSRAAHWYQLSASSGFAKAKVNLAIAYLHGLGVPKNEDFAIQLLTQAYQAGNGTAATYLGVFYYLGIAVKEDRVAAEKFFEAGVKLHDPLGAFNLGSLYSVEENHPHDYRRAADLLRQSADAGYVPAMHSLGLLMLNHPELGSNPAQARPLLEVASNAGFWKSSVALAILARDGMGEPVDPKTAYFHLRVAILQGGAPADLRLKKDIEVMTAKLDKEDRHQADSSAKNWFEHHSIPLEYVFKDSTNKLFPLAAMAVASDGSFAGQLLPVSSSD
jgi:uncharacterized protein